MTTKVSAILLKLAAVLLDIAKNEAQASAATDKAKDDDEAQDQSE